MASSSPSSPILLHPARLPLLLSLSRPTAVMEEIDELRAKTISSMLSFVKKNRSFDHMLGWLRSSHRDIDSLIGRESNPLSNADPTPLNSFIRHVAAMLDNPDMSHTVMSGFPSPHLGCRHGSCDLELNARGPVVSSSPITTIARPHPLLLPRLWRAQRILPGCLRGQAAATTAKEKA